MSLFRVQLQNLVQGRLDMDPSTHPLASGTTAQPALYGNLGLAFGYEAANVYTPSKQRQVYVAGPLRKYRLLKDGDTFTDCNYWKQFDAAYGCDPARAFISTLTDDGSVWSDVASENTYGKGGTVTVSATPTVIDFVGTYGSPARFLQVQNLDATSTNKITGTLNGDTNLTFTIGGGSTQVFNVGDLSISKLSLASTGSFSANWMASLRSAPTS